MWKWRLENRNWRLETGKWSLQTGKWSLETGKWKLEGAKRTSEGGMSCPSGQYPVPVPQVSGALRAKSPDPRGDPSLKYIRSGPEGARGVLKGRGWSLCMFLSELLSFRLSSFCCLSVGLFVTLTGAAGFPGFPGLTGPGLPGPRGKNLARTSVFRPFF